MAAATLEDLERQGDQLGRVRGDLNTVREEERQGGERVPREREGMRDPAAAQPVLSLFFLVFLFFQIDADVEESRSIVRYMRRCCLFFLCSCCCECDPDADRDAQRAARVKARKAACQVSTSLMEPSILTTTHSRIILLRTLPATCCSKAR